VLGHPAFHLNAGAVKPREFPNLNDYVTAMLDQVARAFIRSWNDALDAAVNRTTASHYRLNRSHISCSICAIVSHS
jgi:hypothetical protein